MLKAAKPGTGDEARGSHVTGVIGEETIQQENILSDDLSIPNEIPETLEKTDTLVPLLPNENEIKDSQVATTEAGEDQAVSVNTEFTNSEMTTTLSVIESTHTNLRLADIVTGRFLDATKSTSSREPTITATTRTNTLATTAAVISTMNTKSTTATTIIHALSTLTKTKPCCFIHQKSLCLICICLKRRGQQ